MASPAPTPASPSPSSATINIRETPAVVECIAQAADGRTNAETATPCYLSLSSKSSPVTFYLYFDPSSNVAFFRLRTTISVRDSSADKIQTTVFVFIYPEHVTSLVHDQSSELPPEVTAVAFKKHSGCRTACLRFSLSKPPSLVAPLHVPLAPRSPKDVQVLRSLQTLASATSLAVHFAHEALPVPELLSRLCNAAAAKALKSSIEHGDLSRLYGGQGGKVVEVNQDWPVSCADDENETAALETSARSPPSYDELAPGPPPPLHQGRSLKRPRTRSGYSEGGLEPPDMLGICRRVVTEQMALIRGDLRAEIRREVKAQLGELESGLMERVDQRLEEQIADVRGELSGLIDSNDDRIDEVERHMDDLIDDGIDDRVAGIKIDMMDFVKGEMANVEDTIIKHFEDGRISLQFER